MSAGLRPRLSFATISKCLLPARLPDALPWGLERIGFVSSTSIKITEFLVIYFPLVRILAIVGVVVSATVYLFRIRFPRHSWLTVCARVAGTVLMLMLTLAFILTGLIVLFAARISAPRITVSPDSQHIAYHYYTAGFLGRDSTWVSVGKTWTIEPETVYEYDGPSDWGETELLWVGNDQLLIRYRPDQTHFQQCESKAAGVLIKCERLGSLDWPTP
jgi:hypothetical protein